MSDLVKFAQLQPFRLAGAGTALGATSIVLTTFTQINGTLLTMADFGAIGYITLEPGSGIYEESAVFTGVTQNANGSATLTGVSRVLTVSPYTQTSGLAQAHAGGVSLIVSNTAAFYDSLTDKSDDETITGVWTFTNPNYPRMDTATPAPTDNEQLATKKYVDDTAVSGAPNATTGVKGIVQLATSAQTKAGTNVGSTGASLVAVPSDIATNIQDQQFSYWADTGTANALIITPIPAIASYIAGQQFCVKVATANTTTTTINVNGLGVQNIKKFVASAIANLEANDLRPNSIATIVYDGTQFILISTSAATMTTANQTSANGFFSISTMTGTQANILVGGDTSNASSLHKHISSSGQTSRANGSGTGTQNIAHGLGVTPKLVKITAITTTSANAGMTTSFGSATSTSTNTCTYSVITGTGFGAFGQKNNLIIHSETTGAVAAWEAVISVLDATNITLNFTSVGSGNTIYIQWEAWS